MADGMLATFRRVTTNQFEAALCTLNACVERCPDDSWNGKVANWVFCQLAFHTLFFADLYLRPNIESMREQPFHRANPDFFKDYEEFEPRAPVQMYDKPGILKYVQHCRGKAAQVLAAETPASLDGPSGFDWCRFSRGELHLYNIRHIQHHSAQLSMRLRLDAKAQVPWVGTGWKDLDKK